MFKDKVLLITGGTGSFGNAVLRRFLDSDLCEIRIFSRDEKKQDDMRHLFQRNDPEASKKLKFYVGDVRDYRSIEKAMNGVDFVFHAAALKQVPSCEFFPVEAVKTNILGTQNVLDAAIASGVKRVIVLSTDKAAYPINAMGMSKAMMEKVAVAAGRNLTENQTIICRTRYGNVMASRGSVIPLFCEQLEKGNDLTITNPDMTRFMMTLDDAVDLVIYAFKHGQQGDLFVQKAPAATIGVLAQAVKELKNSNVGIKHIGTRHGEKLYEVLVTQEEMLKSEDLGEYFRVPADNRDLNYDQYTSKGSEELEEITEYNSHNTERLDVEGMKKLLKKLSLFQ
jgi:UDP-glucose 4-epimerase